MKYITPKFLPSAEPFIFERLTNAYEAFAKAHRKPETVEKRAFAGLRARLIRERLIESVEGVYEARSQGNASQVYRSLVK